MTTEISRHGGNISQLAQSSGCMAEEILDFSASINPLGPPEYFRALISRNLADVVHYPDPDYRCLLAQICGRYDLRADQVVVGNGTSELIFALPRLLPIKRVVIPVPTYVDYQRAAELSCCQVEKIVLRQEDGFCLDFDTLAASLQGDEAVFIGQPNNPTGRAVDRRHLLSFVKRHRKTIFIIDEAFADFQGDKLTFLGQGEATYANLIILKSLTKFYAIPGLRLGFLATDPQRAAVLRAALAPWSVNSLALALGEKMLADLEYSQQTITAVAVLRQELQNMLAEIVGLRVFPSEANYLLVKLERHNFNALHLQEKLLEKKIAIRVCDNFIGLGSSYFRIAVRASHDNHILCEALAEICGSRDAHKIHFRKRKTAALMFQGTSSDAGKSILTSGLCRVLLQDGIRVAPFKAQNMSLNSYVTQDGGEMGRAQVVQAQACRLDPETRMNPILLKPSSDVGSQVIVNGQPVANMSVKQYVTYKAKAFQAAKEAYDSLAADYDAIILEGAGSPAEVNLKSHDIVNMNMARYAESPVLLIGDIDRGGIFASFIGSLEVMTEWERQLVAGFVVNRFRGDEALLADAFEYTYCHTGRPTFGVIPYLKNLGLPEEDSVGFKNGLFEQQAPPGAHVKIGLVDLPHISNFTDFEAFLVEPDVHLTIIRKPADLKECDAVILPGSKNVLHDLQFLFASGLAAAIRQLAEEGLVEIIGICGGFQMLGREITDPYGLEGALQADATVQGLALLKMTTVLEKDKTLLRKSAIHVDSGQEVRGYEIHHGQTPAQEKWLFRAVSGTESGARSENGLVWGSYLHGIFDSDAFRAWFIEALRKRKNLATYLGERPIYDLEPALDRLADVLRQRLDMDRIYKLLRLS